MLGVLVIVLGSYPIARLEFCLGQRYVPIIVSSRVVRHHCRVYESGTCGEMTPPKRRRTRVLSSSDPLCGSRTGRKWKMVRPRSDP